jgi:beta-N-acetylhexosaminidase
MISHLSNSELSGSDTPASLNKTIITDILRGELAYDGIVITDSLRMGAVTERFGSAEAAVTAVEAGVDILLMSADFPAARQGILDAVRDGQISEERIDQSLFRILRVRATLK